jgi:hypothetical protein
MEPGMTIRMGVAIMAHPTRSGFVGHLLRSLGDRNIAVVWDRYNDRWDTGSRAMMAYQNRPDVTHWMVLQDDAIVCRDLVAGTERALDHLTYMSDQPTPMSLYMGTRYRRETQMYDRGTSWFTLTLSWGVGIVMPVEFIKPAIDWGNEQTHIKNYDIRLSHWLSHRLIKVWYPWPSLVDHRISPSLVPGRGMNGRHALNFLGEDSSALGVDWTGRVVHGLDRHRIPQELRIRKEHNR